MEKITVTVEDRDFAVGDRELESLDIVGPYAGEYHLVSDGVGYACRLLELDRINKRATIAVNGRRFEVRLADRYDRLVKEMGFATAVASSGKEVVAPMPGLILEVMVKEGTEVSAGTPLLVLEAMKMENVLKAEGDGTVKTVHAAVGDAVDKRQLLIELA